ncbi:MAG: hypothetical protein NXI25_27055, partial [bacterium]|nr:hypothetical protein [bacterium]
MQVEDVRKQGKTRGKAWISAGNALIKSCAMPEMQMGIASCRGRGGGMGWISGGDGGVKSGAMPEMQVKH